uniref:A superfamily conotoxin Bt1.7a n=2 Tax=Conus betulinus TaxID=89764 RepID=S4UKL3_CONBE|nr:A superfamily conotoxin Bt1.7d precursor [Conus betulinus]AGK23277.1 A superfamily conotoxin Bt1.7c precursor [Conus betulinus]AGK23278.1 A superfamily conotoxin Bt1.7b precursor [Conus betulinus]AGK23279.1 A superfamily conotoxin Bt1.7a precursor [Conus betulinus]
MGMRMMFIVFLLVVLATTVVSFTSDRASDGGNAAAKASDLIAQTIRGGCCSYPACSVEHQDLCDGRR